ncbi:MAG: hypothetical protein ABIC40_06095 [bacterium]
MKRMIWHYGEGDTPVDINGFTCEYRTHKEPTPFLQAGQREGIYAAIEFTVNGSIPPMKVDDLPKDPSEKPGIVLLEAIEFTFVIFDIFDNFLGSVQGIAGPGKYSSAKKRNKAQWVFEIDGAFSQYHALCFPSQARFSDGRIWRCDRSKFVEWVNVRIDESGVEVSEDDIFPNGAFG